LFNNTTGYYNSAIGMQALFNNTTGYSNSAIGMQALFNNTTGYSNSAIGMQALYNNTTGSSNSAIGMWALFNNTTGSYNSAIGVQALFDLNTSSVIATALVNGTQYVIQTLGTTDFTLVGAASNAVGVVFTANATSGLGTGTVCAIAFANNNTAIGYNTGRGITTGTGNSILGANVIGLAAGLTNNIILANGLGVIKAQHDGTNWTMTGNVQASNISAAAVGGYVSGYYFSLAGIKVFVAITNPTIASGFGTSPSIVTANGTAAFQVNIGSGGVATSGVLTMPAATTGWACVITNPLVGAGLMAVVDPTSTTSVSISCKNISTGALAAFPTGTILTIAAHGY
jgi:hypothetical protein